MFIRYLPRFQKIRRDSLSRSLAPALLVMERNTRVHDHIRARVPTSTDRGRAVVHFAMTTRKEYHRPPTR